VKTVHSIYDQAVEITEDYLGPAAKRFIDRQVLAHLDKDPERLTRPDLSKLMVWLEAAVALLTDDKKIVDEYSAKLKELARGQIGAK
jgi:hypothetical protein